MKNDDILALLVVFILLLMVLVNGFSKESFLPWIIRSSFWVGIFFFFYIVKKLLESKNGT